jgi:hypothetical protein
VIQTLDTVSLEPFQVGPDWMERVVSRRRLHGLPGDLNRNKNALFLEPFRSKPVFVIRPFSLGHNTPWRRFQRNRSEPKFV